MWNSDEFRLDKATVAYFYLANIVFNALWSVLYFGSRNAVFGFFDLILIWISTAYIIIATWKVNRAASWLMIPYLLWVTFAGVLNFMSI